VRCAVAVDCMMYVMYGRKVVATTHADADAEAATARSGTCRPHHHLKRVQSYSRRAGAQRCPFPTADPSPRGLIGANNAVRLHKTKFVSGVSTVVTTAGSSCALQPSLSHTNPAPPPNPHPPPHHNTLAHCTEEAEDAHTRPQWNVASASPTTSR